MDKNTIIGLLLMFLVIMGFTWLNQPSEAEIAQAKAQQEQAEKKAKTDNTEQTKLMADSISDEEMTRLKSSIQLYGRSEVAENGATTHILESNEARLSYDGNEITGTICVDGKNVDFNTIFSDTDVKLRNRAIKALQDAVYTYTRSGEFAKCLIGEDKVVTLQNDVLKIDIATKGGAICNASLLKYDTYKSPTVTLFDKNTNAFGFVFNTNAQRFDTGDFYFTPIAQNDSTVTMQLDLGNNVKWGIRYTLAQGSYMVKMEVFQQNMERVIPQNIPNLDIYWTQRMARQEKGKMFEERNSAI